MTTIRTDAAFVTALANKKGYLPFGPFRTLDGSDVATMTPRPTASPSPLAASPYRPTVTSLA